MFKWNRNRTILYKLFQKMETRTYQDMGNEKVMNNGESNAVMAVPAGYDTSNVAIRRPKNQLPELAKQKPETVAEMLEHTDDLEVCARLLFLRKVYIIVTLMLTVTIGFCFLSYFVKGFFQFQIDNYWCFYVFLGIAVALVIVFMCFGTSRVAYMSQTTKVAILSIIVLCFSYVVSFCTSVYANAYGAPLVLEAMFLTIGLVLALTLYAFVTKNDFRTCIAIMIVVLFAFILFGISFAFTMSGTLHTLYATFGCILAGIILVIDTQWVADGNRGCSLDDPLMGALIIYIDIIRVFLYLLQAMGSSSKS